MAAPRTIITSARYGLAYQPRTGIAVAGYPVMYKRIVCVLGYPPYVAGTVVSELLRRHSGDIRVIWWRTTVTIEIYDQNNQRIKSIKDLVRIGLYNTKVQVLGTDSTETLIALRKILEKVKGDPECVPPENSFSYPF